MRVFALALIVATLPVCSPASPEESGAIVRPDAPGLIDLGREGKAACADGNVLQLRVQTLQAAGSESVHFGVFDPSAGSDVPIDEFTIFPPPRPGDTNSFVVFWPGCTTADAALRVAVLDDAEGQDGSAPSEFLVTIEEPEATSEN